MTKQLFFSHSEKFEICVCVHMVFLSQKEKSASVSSKFCLKLQMAVQQDSGLLSFTVFEVRFIPVQCSELYSVFLHLLVLLVHHSLACMFRLCSFSPVISIVCMYACLCSFLLL